MYGIHDFVSASVAWKPIPKEIYELVGIDAVDAQTVPVLVRASPVISIRREMPPFLLLHGSKDEVVPHAQPVEMCQKLKAEGAHCDLITIEGPPHGMEHWK